ncbi:glycosyltransferase family 2 protein [Mucilaginibacter sp. KACC 22063]|uniref:glycosyltransferase family 2 protein n=1 Tax=Mucilaginibacter sp. KACC 22063 TaxID=3025666 RepID=UPI002366053F|nr:glycosyltransferase [Mucilaginibacter sp. KACC 22063]WDF54464.1 glycosyltransferase [Mucilaginibacter sp. KACC 22063]
MNVSIVIPTFNRNDLLSKCLDSLALGTQKVDSVCEVIVTDDSPDELAKPLLQEKYPWARWVAGPRRGPAANRNNGVKEASGQWIIFLDDDCLPQKDWLKTYIEAIQTYGDTENVLEGYTDADRPKQRFDEEAPINKDGNKLWSCNFAIKKSLFIVLGGFDETFPYAAMEDIDFQQRVLAKTSVKFLSDAKVIHPWRRIKPFRNLKKHFKSHQHFAKKYGLTSNPSFRITRTKIFIGSIFGDFKKLVKFSMKGWPVYIEKCILNLYLIFV